MLSPTILGHLEFQNKTKMQLRKIQSSTHQHYSTGANETSE